MQISLADGLKARVRHIAPYTRVTVIATQYGDAVKLEGKGAKKLAAYFARERFLDGETNTNWAPICPRHGLGYIIPMYENPLDLELRARTEAALEGRAFTPFHPAIR